MAIPGFETTDRRGASLLSTTLRQRDEALRQRDEACQEAEALRWKEVNSRQQATFWKTQHRRAQARAESARNELKRLKSASSVNELEREVSRLKHDLAKLRKRLDEAERGNARLKAHNRKLVRDKFESERTRRSRKSGTEQDSRRRRGRQPGSPSHGRTPREDLPVEVEVIWGMPLPELRQALREKRRKSHRVRRGRGSRRGVVAGPDTVRHAHVHRSRRWSLRRYRGCSRTPRMV